MAEQPAAGNPTPRAIGIDEIAIGRGLLLPHCRQRLDPPPAHLVRRPRPPEQGLDAPSTPGWAAKNPAKSAWPSWTCGRRFATPPRRGNAPQAEIVFDKFHVLRHLQTAFDPGAQSDERLPDREDRCFIKGQKYTLLSRCAQPHLKGKKALKLLFKVNKRLNTAYLLKESFEQLWD
ncbi:MAG: transposase [Gemmataceae bacterium]